MTSDPNQLVNDARCIARCIPIGMQLPVLISLMLQVIANQLPPNPCIVCGDVDPVADPNCPCALGYNRITGAFFDWDNVAKVWVPLIV